MRRTEKEVSDRAAIEDIIMQSNVCKLAMCDGNKPYIVPLCFGFKENVLYFHSALKGKKIEILKQNPDVCFEFDTFTQVVKSAEACKWGMRFKSVIGYGRATFIIDDDLKKDAFDIIMNQYGSGSFSYEAALLKSAIIIKVEIDSMTGKQSNI